MNIRINNITIFTILFLVILAKHVIANEAPSLNTPQSIDLFLNETENLRTQNFSSFSQNLTTLESMRLNLDVDQLCFYDYLKSYRNIYIGEIKTAEENLSKLFDDCDELNIKIRIKATLANHYFVAKDYYNSIVSLNYVISNIDKTKNKKTKHIAYTIAFLVYERLNRNELSLKYIDLLLNDSPGKDLICKALSTKYSIQLKTVIFNEIEDEIINAINHCEENNEYVFSNILKLFYLQNKLSNFKSTSEVLKIIHALKSSETQIEKTKYDNIIGLKNSLYAESFIHLGDMENAVKYALRTIEIENTSGRSNYKSKALRILIQYAEQLGDYDKAFEYLKRVNEIEKSNNNDSQAQTIAYYSVTHENLANTHKIEFLNKQNEVLQLQNNLSEESKLNQQLIILSLLLASAFFILWGYKHRREREIFKNLSEMDPMTLIYNRKGLRDHMNYLLPYSEKKGEVIAYAIFDLDHFKNINDKYGHVTGDWVIENVIKVCKKIKGNNEKITLGRLGGEEFAIIIRDSNIEELKEYCETCRQKIQDLDTSDSSYHFNVTASFGLTSSVLSSYVYTNLLTNADKALYHAKDAGRNQIKVYQQS